MENFRTAGTQVAYRQTRILGTTPLLRCSVFGCACRCAPPPARKPVRVGRGFTVPQQCVFEAPTNVLVPGTTAVPRDPCVFFVAELFSLSSSRSLLKDNRDYLAVMLS